MIYTINTFLFINFFIDPISNVTTNGGKWLQHGDMLNLQVKCYGSPPFDYCIKIKPGQYNMTGNETCTRWLPLDKCDFSIVHYFSNVSTYTILIILRNQVMKLNKEVTITIYEANTQSQLSVIVVPVSFSLFAVILVVFAVAYYIQNRNRYVKIYNIYTYF